MRPPKCARLLATAATAVSLVGCGAGGQEVDCRGVSIDAVRLAVDEVDGYSYTVSGTDQLATVVLTVGEPPAYEFEPAPVEATGAYRAPNAARIEITTGIPPQPPKHSSVFIDWLIGVDAYVRIGDEAWARNAAGRTYFALPAGTLYPTPNTLSPLLGAVAFGVELPGQPWQDSFGIELAWAGPTADGACILTGRPRLDPGLEGFELEVILGVDPQTNLPSTVDLEANVPDSGNPWAFDVRFTFDYDTLPEIKPPTEVGPPPTSEGDATPPPSSSA